MGLMSESLVARAEPDAKRAMQAALNAQRRPTRELTDVQVQAARAYGHGMQRNQIAKAMLEAITPNSVGKPAEYRLMRAKAILRRWERRQIFRDLVYSTAVTQVDMQVPLVLNGVVDKAKRGRVDAARLALEITGRHNPKGEQAAPTVVVAIDGVPRPVQIADAEVVDADAVER